MQTIASLFFKFWTWLTNRSLEAEHIGMAAVIVISTWHVWQHMHAVEGSPIVAAIMGAVLGFLNALCAMRFFEERQETRWPAGVGGVFFAAVSIGMQYGFYDGNTNLTPYMVDNVNVNALMFGAWAPIAEIFLGWLYGVRLFTRGASNKVIEAIKEKYDRQAAEVQGKLTVQLNTNQQLRDDLYEAKLNGQEKDALLAAKDATIARLQESITDLRVVNARVDTRLELVNSRPKPDSKPAQLTGKLNVTERRQKVDELRNDLGMSIAEVARKLGVAKNTVRADLRELQPVVHTNSHNGAAS